MLNRNELEKYGSVGFHLGQKEKDYVQHWILSYLSQSGYSGIFKGGTCLQKAFSLPRYSEDLDFTETNDKLVDLDALSAFLSAAGFSGVNWKKTETKVSTRVKITYRGPLYNGSLASQNAVILDFSKKEKVVFEPNRMLITPPYPDILPYQLQVMKEKEIAAEKIRALLTRESARDLFDLFFLLRRKSDVEYGTVQMKLLFYNKKFQYTEFEKRVKRLGDIWLKEIRALTPNVLPYEVVAPFVLSEIKARLGTEDSKQ